MSQFSDVQCISTQDPGLLRRLLSFFPIEAAYMLGDLQEPFFSHSRWFVAMFRNKPQAILLVYEGLSTPTLLSFGAPDLISTLLDTYDAELPAQGYAKIPHTHETAFLRYRQLFDLDHMWCMGLSTSTWSPRDWQEHHAGSFHQRRVVRQLHDSDSLDSMLAVYRDYPGHFFEPQQLQSGVYYGSFVEEQLCCIVGTHVYAPQEGVAVLGNIVTAQHARRQGHAQACLLALISDLRQRGCASIALHVSDRNLSAIRCYRSVGFLFQSTLIDAPFRTIA